MKVSVGLKKNPLTCLKVILACILFSTSSIDGPSSLGLFGVWVGVVVGVISFRTQLNSPSDSIPVKVNSSINPFLITCCSIIIFPDKLFSKTHVISTWPAAALGRWHLVK